MARALGYSSDDALNKAWSDDSLEVRDRFIEAYRRLFAQAELDVDKASPSELFNAVSMMVKQLPEQWSKWLDRDLQQHCSDPEITGGSAVRRISDCVLLLW
jgi:hypothetical protein